MRCRRSPVLPVACLALVAVLGACGDAGDDPQPIATGAEGPSGELRVAAAASLTDVFGEIADDFEAVHPGVDLVVDFGPSSALADSIVAGAPVDVFASADTVTMDVVVDAGAAAGEPRVFAVNSMVVAVPAGNPGGVRGLGDLARDDLLVGLCAADVPCGRIAREVLANAAVQPVVDTDEPDVKALLTKIEQDELDVGMVYVTDVVAAADAVEAIAVPAEVAVSTSYPVVRVAGSDVADLADAFIAFLLSGPGADALSRAGFGSP